MANISLLEMGNTKKRGTREAIISILSREFPLSIKKIYNQVKKEYHSELTYQAVFKLVKEMMQDNILEKSDKEYKLNINWIKQLENEIGVIKKNYGGGGKEVNENLQGRINEFVAKLGPKIKEYIGKDEACVLGVSGGGRIFAMGLLKYLLREGTNVKYSELSWLDQEKNPLIKKEDVEGKKVILVDSEIYSGDTYKIVMEKFSLLKNKFKIKDIKFVADKDVRSLADFSVN